MKGRVEYFVKYVIVINIFLFAVKQIGCSLADEHGAEQKMEEPSFASNMAGLFLATFFMAAFFALLIKAYQVRKENPLYSVGLVGAAIVAGASSAYVYYDVLSTVL